MKTEISPKIKAVLNTIRLAPEGQAVTGRAISVWLGHRGSPDPVRESLKALVRRGLVTMTPMDDPKEEWRRQFPDYMIATFQIAGCLYPDKCIMPGPHFRSECCTADMVQQAAADAQEEG